MKHVFETSGLTKWSHIARKMEVEHGITGRSGKQCRERYFLFDADISHISTVSIENKSGTLSWSKDSSNCTTRSETSGQSSASEWAECTSIKYSRSDNSIKNHFYSLLRRALRKLNTIMVREHYKDIKDFKPPILYRIVEVAD